MLQKPLLEAESQSLITSVPNGGPLEFSATKCTVRIIFRDIFLFNYVPLSAYFAFDYFKYSDENTIQYSHLIVWNTIF